MSSETFSALEAMKLLGKQVSSRCDREGIPKGTPGRVIWIRGRVEDAGGFNIAIRWQDAVKLPTAEFTKTEFEDFLAIASEPA